MEVFDPCGSIPTFLKFIRSLIHRLIFILNSKIFPKTTQKHEFRDISRNKFSRYFKVLEWCQTIPNLPKLRKRSVMFQFSKFLTILVYLNVLKSWRLCFRVFIDSFQVCRMVQIFGLVDPPPERVIIRPINTIFGAYLHTNSMLWKWNNFFPGT